MESSASCFVEITRQNRKLTFLPISSFFPSRPPSLSPAPVPSAISHSSHSSPLCCLPHRPSSIKPSTAFTASARPRTSSCTSFSSSLPLLLVVAELLFVHSERLTIANSVEQRILDLQQRKQDLTEHAFGEGKGKSAFPFPLLSFTTTHTDAPLLTELGKLTVGDLAALFNLRDDGTVKERAPRRRRGPVIAADDH